MSRYALLAGAAMLLGGCLSTPEPVFDETNSLPVGEIPEFIAFADAWESFVGADDSPREMIADGGRGLSKLWEMNDMTTPDRVVEVPREKLAEWLDWAEEIGLGIEYGKGISATKEQMDANGAWPREVMEMRQYLKSGGV